MRFAIIVSTLVTVAASASGVLTWYWIEASKQAAIFGGVQVLPPIGETIFITALIIGVFTLTATLMALRLKAGKIAILALAVSVSQATLYGLFGSSLYEGAPPFVIGAIVKASSIVILGGIALWTRDVSPTGAGGGKLERATSGRASVAGGDALPPSNKLLAAGLLFGATGDALLAWSPDTFLYGAFAFLIGHLFYIALFLRSGLGLSALKQPPRLIAALALIVAALVMTALLVPHDNPMFAPLSVYTGVLTLMAICSFTLPTTRWLVMLGAVLFFISDGFVAANLFHPLEDATLAYWRSFAGWMIYWAGQAAICFGALGLHKAQHEAK